MALLLLIAALCIVAGAGVSGLHYRSYDTTNVMRWMAKSRSRPDDESNATSWPPCMGDRCDHPLSGNAGGIEVQLITKVAWSWPRAATATCDRRDRRGH